MLLNRACPVCAESESRPFLRKGELHLVRCIRCSMIYADPVPAEMASGEFYDRAGEEYLSADKLESDYAPVRFERELRLFHSHCPRGSVLDIGCSSGAFLHQLNHRHPGRYRILGADAASAPLDYAARMGIPVIRGDFLTASFVQAFDAITFWATMEHLFEPRAFLKKAASLLKPGGLCFILVPNFRSLAVRLLGGKYRYIFSEHLNYFTPETLAQFAGQEFSGLKFKSIHFNPVVIWQDFRRGTGEIARADRSRLLKRTNAMKQSPWLFPLKLSYRAAEAVLGRLFLADNLVVIGRRD
jgi:2-polyprenyl-3-methyl-5-hydroxy-6-metoxy-1,4-benzoquinol methylase